MKQLQRKQMQLRILLKKMLCSVMNSTSIVNKKQKLWEKRLVVEIFSDLFAQHLNEWRSPYPAMAKELQDAAADLATLKFEVIKKVGDAIDNVQAYKL